MAWTWPLRTSPPLAPSIMAYTSNAALRNTSVWNSAHSSAPAGTRPWEGCNIHCDAKGTSAVSGFACLVGWLVFCLHVFNFFVLYGSSYFTIQNDWVQFVHLGYIPMPSWEESRMACFWFGGFFGFFGFFFSFIVRALHWLWLNPWGMEIPWTEAGTLSRQKNKNWLTKSITFGA